MVKMRRQILKESNLVRIWRNLSGTCIICSRFWRIFMFLIQMLQTGQWVEIIVKYDCANIETVFYPCGVHPVALCIRIPFKYTCDRNWEFIGVTFILSVHNIFRHLRAILRRNTTTSHILTKPSILQRIRCFTIAHSYGVSLLLSTLWYI
jgi:hypothetical protein